MYLITLYNRGIPSVIHSEFSRVQGARIVRKKNEISSFSFKIYPNNDGYEYLTEFATTINVVNLHTGETEFDGRVISVVPSMDSDGSSCKDVTCEDVMGFLLDSRQPYTEERNWTGDTTRNGLQEFIDYLLANHNAHMPSEKRVYRGVVDVQTFATTENVTKSTNYERTLDIIKDKLVNVFGGELIVRRGDDGCLYLDYCEMIGTVRSTPIRIGHNMLSAKREVKPDQLITRLYPRGCKLTETETDDSGNEREVETENRLSIASVNLGVEYIDDDEAVKLYGVIEGEHDWDDVTEPLVLLSKATKWIKDNNRLPVSTSVSAYDLSLLGLDFYRFNLYDWYPCFNPLIGLDETLEIVGQTIDVNEPQESVFDLGESTTLQSQKIATLKGLAGEVEYVKSQTKTNIVNLKNTIVYTMAAIEVAEDRIVSTVGEQIVETSERLDGEIKVLVSSVSKIDQRVGSIDLSVQQLTEDQSILQTELELLPESIVATVTAAYELYVGGEIKIVNASISKVEQTAQGLTTSVQSLQACYGTCTTAGSTVAKVVSAPNFILRTGATISIKFSYANTASNPTLNINGTGAAPIYVNNAPIASGYFWGAQDVVSFVYSGSAWLVSDCGSNSKIKQLAGSISLQVSNAALGSTASIIMTVDGSTITNNIDLTKVRNAFRDDKSAITISAGTVTFNSNTFVVNSTYFKVTSTGVLTATSGTIGGLTLSSYALYSNYLELDSSGLTLYSGSRTSANRVVDMTSRGTTFFRSGTEIGTIGTNSMANDSTKKGLNFDLENAAAYMTWAWRATANASTYSMKWSYASKSIAASGGTWAANRLHAGADIDMHGFRLFNAWIDPSTGGANGGISATINYVQILSVDANGNPTKWGTNGRMVFKNGMLTDLTYYA